MIFSTADGDGLESVLSRDASEIRPEDGETTCGNRVAALFRGEDAMHEAGDVGVGHGFRSSRRGSRPSGTN
jgi:hypothetical protein